MPSSLVDGLALVDTTGRLILATTLTSLALAVGATFAARARYDRLERDLDENAPAHRRFLHPVLNDIAASADAAARRSPDPNVQAILEDHVHGGMRGLLLAERFVRAATGLVIILGLLGTFYGLTSSIGKLVDLVSGDTSNVTDVAQTMTGGLTQALTGMAVAFSNSLVGILSAVVLTVLGIFTSLADRRMAFLVRVETVIEQRIAGVRVAATPDDRLERTMAGFGESVTRLESTVARFESALGAFSSGTREFSEFNAHLKDNVQRMSLSFGDLSDALKDQIVLLNRGDSNGRR